MNSNTTLLQRPISNSIVRKRSVSSFSTFCEKQEQHRPIWFVVSLYALISGFVPLSALIVLYFQPAFIVPYLVFTIPTFFANAIIYGFDLKMKVNLSLFFITIVGHTLITIIGLLA